MRNIFIFIILSLFFFSCSEKKIGTYQGEYDSIYFEVGDSLSGYRFIFRDSTQFSFLSLEIEDTVLSTIKIKVMGDVVDYPREAEVEIVREKTDAPEHTYYLPTRRFVIPAGEEHTYLTIKLIWAPELEENEYRICFRLKENKYFRNTLEKVVLNKERGEYANVLEHTLIYSDVPIRPLNWSDDGPLQKWTRKKHLLISRLRKMSQEDWDHITVGRFYALSVFMRTYLRDQCNSGNPIYEDNGDLMKVDGYDGCDEDEDEDEDEGNNGF